MQKKNRVKKGEKIIKSILRNNPFKKHTGKIQIVYYHIFC